MAISCLSVNIYAQTESRFSGLEPIGHYADETLNKNDYQNALDQVFFKGHDFEYAFLVEPSFSEEYALLIGDGSLTALVADKQVWGFLQADQYLPVQSNVMTFKDPNGDIRPMTMTAMIDMPQSEGRMSRSDVPKTTEHSVSVSESLTDAFVRMIEMACYTSSYLSEESTGSLVLDGVRYAFIPSGRYGGMAASVHSGYKSGPSEQLVSVMEKTYDLVFKERADSLATLFADMEECYKGFLSFIPDNMIKNDTIVSIIGLQFDRNLFENPLSDEEYCASLLVAAPKQVQNPEEKWDAFFKTSRLIKSGSKFYGTVSGSDGLIPNQTVAEVDHLDFHVVQQTTTNHNGSFSFVVQDNHNLLRIEREGYDVFYSMFYNSVIDCVLRCNALTIYGDEFTEDGLSYQKISDSSVKVWTENKDIVSVTIPAEVQGLEVVKIADFGFDGCDKLESVKIPNTVVEIGNNAFKGCASLESIAIPNSVTKSGENIFAGCSNLKEVYNSSIFFYLNPSYEGEYRLKNAKTANTIASKAFYGCSGLTSVIIPDNVTEIGSGAFANSGINRIVLPEALTGIASMMFDGCGNLEEVDIPANVTRIGAYAFSGTGIRNVAIPDSVLSIGTEAFSGCRNIETLVIPNSVISIDNAAFKGCTGLKSAVLSESLYYLPQDLFMDCTGIEELSLPISIGLIGNGSMGCSNLKTLNVYWDNPAAYEYHMGDPFRGLIEPDCTLYVPKGSASAYKAAYSWQLFNIEER